MNDDLTGYHRNGVNIEAAEEHCVLQAVGEAVVMKASAGPESADRKATPTEIELELLEADLG